MKLRREALVIALASVWLASGCGSDSGSNSSTGDDGGGVTDDGGGAGSKDGGGSKDAGATSDARAGDAASSGDGASGGDASSSGDSSTTNDSGGGSLHDPNLDGPFPYAERDATTTIAATTDSVAIHVAYPTMSGSYPIIVVGHGFQLPTSQYYSYLKRLASFGYVAMTVDFPASLFGPNNPNEAKDMIGGIDWAKNDSMLGPIVDATTAGMSGHSLGGKVALLAATMDARVKAAFLLDPVDGGAMGCTAPNCVEVKALMPSLHIPTGFIGETTDATSSSMACAPAADDFATFYAQTVTPSLEITALGANHMSFLDNVSSCGITCSFCNAATAPNAQVNGMARAFMVAFYERYLRGITGYDAYLTGAQAQARYVTTTQATITSK